ASSGDAGSAPPDSTAGSGSDGAAPTGFGVVTNRYDNSRLGANTSETTLNVANVGGGKFGLLFSRQVDGHLYAQPLYLPGLTINGAVHNVVFVATEHDSVYAFDADNAAVATPLWQVSLGTPMDAVPGAGTGHPLVPPQTVTCRDMFPKTGITSTPVIDRATGRMFVVAKTYDVASATYHQSLHALDVLTGKDVAGSPVEITGSVKGTGVGGDDAGAIPFSAYHHLNRPGLLLTGGNVYIAFASHCDDPPYHGWVFAYGADTLTQKGIYNTTPNGTQGGIWQSGMGLVGDTNDVYFVSGNGDFDPTNSGSALGLSVGHLKLGAAGFNVADWWTAPNAGALNAHDVDLTSAPVLLPNPKVMVAGGKDGNFYVFDPANLGKYQAAGTNILQTFPTASASAQAHIHSGPVYWNGPKGPTLYVWPQGLTLRSYAFTGNQIATAIVSEHLAHTATHPGGNVSLSANGSMAGTGVVWATFTSTVIDTVSPTNKGDSWHNLVPGAFFAFDAANLTTPIWTSLANKARDDSGIFAKFNPPIVANGRVYVASQMSPDGGKLLVYGLLP
ncbi:MAG: hypothetical protein M3O32_21510, partial [Actinomycetota bacterium]|nr:hypothetical protein [Actinomycetota bacterium]